LKRIICFLLITIPLVPLTVFAAYKIPARTINISGNANGSPSNQPEIIATTHALPPSGLPNEATGAGISPITGTSSIKNYVKNEAKAYGVNPTDALWIVAHESQFDPTRTGDDGQSRGLWQISSKFHPEVGDACAYSITCSTDWSLNWILKGNISQWSTWKYRFLWYANENPPL